MRRLLVLGDDGMLGSMVARAARSRAGFEVVGTRRRGGGGSIAFAVEEGIEALARRLAERPPFDLWVNAIGYRADRMRTEGKRGIPAGWRVNATFPPELAALAKSSGARLLHFSTDAVFAPLSGAVDETASPDPGDDYGKGKLAGEPQSPSTIVMRCSMIGPDPARRRGLLEWFLGQSAGASVDGFRDLLWCGVTTLQVAELALELCDRARFYSVRTEGVVHHFCPNEPLSKCELLLLFRELFRPDVEVRRVTAPSPVTRRLATIRQTIPAIAGSGRSMRKELERLCGA